MHKVRLCLAAILLLAVPAALAQTPLKLLTKYEIPATVKGRFDHLGIDLASNRLFVVAEEAGRVLVLDLGSGKIVHTIVVPHPHAVLVRDDVNYIYITDEEKGAVNIYDAKSYHFLRAVALKVDTDSIGYDPATHYLYVDNGGDNAHEEFTMLTSWIRPPAQRLRTSKSIAIRLKPWPWKSPATGSS